MRTLLFLFLTFNLTGQNTKTQAALDMIGPYEVDEQGYISIVKVIELDSSTKYDIYKRAEEFFTYNYGSGESVLQILDKEGGRLIGKGKYPQTANIIGVPNIQTDTWHILRVDVKDNKAKITLSLTEYAVVMYFDNDTRYSTVKVSSAYPINKSGKFKNAFGQGFAESYRRAWGTIGKLTQTLKSKDTDW